MKTKLGEGPLAWSAFILIVWISTVLAASHLSGLKSYHNAYEDAYRESTQHNKYNAAERKCRASISPSKAVDCIIEAEKADRERHNAEQDLNAQRQMADWAWAMMWATIATTLITALGVILIAVTLLYTRNTLDLAQSTNDAAWETVTVTREIGEKQVRAYIGPPNILAKLEMKDGSVWLRTKATVSNSGNSPAIAPRISFAIMRNDSVLNFFQRELERDIAAGETEFEIVNCVAPLSDISETTPDFPPRFRVSGEIQYFTVFGELKMRTTFDRMMESQDAEGNFRVRMNRSENTEIRD